MTFQGGSAISNTCCQTDRCNRTSIQRGSFLLLVVSLIGIMANIRGEWSNRRRLSKKSLFLFFRSCKNMLESIKTSKNKKKKRFDWESKQYHFPFQRTFRIKESSEAMSLDYSSDEKTIEMSIITTISSPSSRKISRQVLSIGSLKRWLWINRTVVVLLQFFLRSFSLSSPFKNRLVFQV